MISLSMMNDTFIHSQATRHSLSKSAGFMTLMKGFLKSTSDPEARELRELMLDDLDMQSNSPPTNEDLK